MSADAARPDHRIVAIGASAGGLEPLEQLFATLPADTGCSFVLVQHLSPDFRSMMSELLARHTRMPIEPLSNGMALEPNRVYLNLPRITATLEHGRIKLEDMEHPCDLHRPIDRFLGSLATDCAERTLAIILSGTASDGSDGAAHLKAKGGRVIAQSPATARFDSMPRAVIDARLNDAVGSPRAIAALIVRWVAGETLEQAPLQRLADDPVGSILALIRRRYDSDLAHCTSQTLDRRIRHGARLRHCKDLDAYADLLFEHDEALDELYGDLLVGTKPVFQDRDAFAGMQAHIGPALAERMKGPLRSVGAEQAIGHEAADRISAPRTTGPGPSEECRYRWALEELLGVGNRKEEDHDSLLTRSLEIGLRYLELDSACLAQRGDHDDRILAVAGTATQTATHATDQAATDRELSVQDRVLFDRLPHDRSVLGFSCSQELIGDDPDLARYAGVHSYIGARLSDVDGLRTAISFRSGVARRRPFSVADKRFVLLLGDRLSALLDQRRRLDAMSDGNRHDRSLYLNLPIMVFLADDAGRVIELSKRLLERLGRSRGDVVDRQALSLFVPDQRGSVAEALAQGRCRDLALTLDLGDGQTLDCDMDCRLHDIGNLRRIRLCVLSDVSVRNRALAAIQVQNQRLALVNEHLNQFAFVASHDLQEPLRKIQQFSGFLQSDQAERVDDVGRYHLKVIEQAAERMSALIKDLLAYSRTSRGTVDRRRVSLRSILDEVLDDLEVPAREAQARVQVGELPVLSADPLLVRQLLTNLIGNALKYRAEQRPLELWIGPGANAAGEPDPDLIELKDNGIGFDPGQARRIFEPFTRLNGVQHHAGSGIGLAICASVCEKHGWTLSAHGIPGKGSTFRIDVAGARVAVEDAVRSD